ncbi:MAG: UDP-N-acetylmuramoyl-L-alanine--D-glutamate ligase [Bryobacteraceae bacterium]|nr:UDP-N-acetylmuramoyl-L-alanine--D-glutamate ligase [Bryobacteraceae bacterium]
MKFEVSDRIVLVVGLGRSGISAASLLREHGAVVRVTDIKGGPDVLPQTTETFTSVDLVVLSPGVPLDLPEVLAAQQSGIPVIGEVELAGYWLRGPVIGITGSNGKTTTTAMIGHILQQAGVPCQVGGNIGTAPTAMVASSLEKQWNVLELSSFQLETIHEFRVDISVGLNVTPDHLDRHHTFERYSDAKARMFELQNPGTQAVLNADDGGTSSWQSRTKAEVHWFSRKQAVPRGMWLKDGILTLDGGALLPAQEIPLQGVHNIENTMAAALASHLAGAGREAIAAAIRTFPGVEHRIEFVRERNGVRYYNDSKATNVDAAEKAIDAFDGNLWIILGGKDKGSDYTVLEDKLRAKAKGILLIGSASEKIAGHLSGLALTKAGNMETALQIAAANATVGDVVLLAPACASFDQFENYEHRGRVFKDLVRNL